MERRKLLEENTKRIYNGINLQQVDHKRLCEKMIAKLEEK